jgi:hypothetical protein
VTKRRLAVADEATAKKAFAWAIDWPGWCRSGKDRELARQALLDYAPRYAMVARIANLEYPELEGAELDVVESIDGGAGTEFGVPSAITPGDRHRLTAREAMRFAALVSAAWTVFDDVAAKAPADLRKGPRGGGRDRDKMIGHVIESDHAYARQIGIRLPQPAPSDRGAIRAERDAMLDVLGRPSDGSPLADRRWPPRYAARRIAWHALDHAWEMEDRST